ncbi:hypothetical protein QUB56_21460 [Microcoleus sp. AR_TQ3_B6]|uniref:hypothetical protein n=1 Tax=Microcoleus sp. AR_TQ3_B6 TaxID=3055284 RepID=UPI002FD06C6A
MSPQEQNPWETATATVIDRAVAPATKTPPRLKPMGFGLGRFYQIEARHRVNASNLRCLPQF